MPKSNHVDAFIAYNCRFVTCDYSQWSAWSATCGTGMRRARNLVKVNEHYIKKQGGCSGLKVTCDRQETETRTTTNCKFNICIKAFPLWLAKGVNENLWIGVDVYL